ncbi:polyprenol reductase-like [Aricia agestis]|uniref:polyprenol reductase-like n=1 Tax=Aricia agestis TaxID=91739 RepID=UPI001C2084AA|nr:polyprenol reductase-like [Aricia agestis]
MLNVLDTIFLIFLVLVIFIDQLLQKYENIIPVLSKCFKYGNFAYRGKGAEYLSVIEIPKSTYLHFYLCAVVFGGTLFLYAIGVYFLNFPVNRYLSSILHFLCQKNEPSVSVAAALLTLLLILLQTSRRYYETSCLQVFSKSAKINIIHYLVGHVHYCGIILTSIGGAPLFCGNQDREKINWIDGRTTVVALPCIAIFLWAWQEQYQSNVILANLRKDKKSGEVVTEKYKVPMGRMFNYVSSPHRFCEIVLYLVYFVLIPTKTYFIIFLWVLGNQVLGAKYTNDWYKNTFKEFPKDKKAIIPGIF